MSVIPTGILAYRRVTILSSSDTLIVGCTICKISVILSVKADGISYVVAIHAGRVQHNGLFNCGL